MKFSLSFVTATATASSIAGRDAVMSIDLESATMIEDIAREASNLADEFGWLSEGGVRGAAYDFVSSERPDLEGKHEGEIVFFGEGLGLIIKGKLHYYDEQYSVYAGTVTTGLFMGEEIGEHLIEGIQFPDIIRTRGDCVTVYELIRAKQAVASSTTSPGKNPAPQGTPTAPATTTAAPAPADAPVAQPAPAVGQPAVPKFTPTEL